MKTNIEKTIAVILFSGLLISLGACIGVLVTENHHLKQPLEFREVQNIEDFLAFDLWINESNEHDGFYWLFAYLPELKEIRIKTEIGTIVNVTLLCVKEGYFIKYPDYESFACIPAGFNSSFLHLHTTLSFSDVNSSELIIRNISFWQVIK